MDVIYLETTAYSYHPLYDTCNSDRWVHDHHNSIDEYSTHGMKMNDDQVKSESKSLRIDISLLRVALPCCFRCDTIFRKFSCFLARSIYIQESCQWLSGNPQKRKRVYARFYLDRL